MYLPFVLKKSAYDFIRSSGGLRICLMEEHLPKGGDAELLFDLIFPNNCMKTKEV